jgi:hypothetical protein
VRKYLPILMLLFGTRTSPLFTWVSTDGRSFVTRDKDEKRAKKVAADSIMGKVLIALSKASLLDPEMMFSEGKLPLPFYRVNEADERRKEKYVPDPPPKFPRGGI